MADSKEDSTKTAMANAGKSVDPDAPGNPEESPDKAETEALGDAVADEPAVTPDALPARPAPNRDKPPSPTARTERRPAKSSRLIATLALLLSLVAAGLAGYLYWEMRMDDPDVRLDAAVAAYQSELVDLRRATTDQIASLGGELDRVREELAAERQALADARSAMADVAAAGLEREPPTPRAWKLAEVEYLLTVANHRLLMQDDADGAEQLLALTDQVLVDLDDFLFHDVRALIAEELLALRMFEAPDIQGVFLRLEAIKDLLGELPLRLPDYTRNDERDTAPAEPRDDPSLFDTFLDRLGGLVRFRRHEGEAVRPLLAPEQADYLEQHLRLAVERAQLALLRRDQRIFESSLHTARDWLHRFVDPNRAAVVEAIGELEELLVVDLDVAVPDISRSRARLRELRWGSIGEAAPE